MLLAHSPELFFPKIPFSDRYRLFCVALVFFLFERLGDGYFFLYLLKYDIETPDRTVSGTSIKLPFFFFTRTVPKGLTFGLFICFTFVYNVHVLYCTQCVSFELVKTPEVTLCA